MKNRTSLKEIAKLFFKLGIIGFGGPAAHIAMMREEVVVKRKWFNEQHFLDLIGATSLIPGPNSTELAIHIGHEKAGWKGLITAGLCFILPAVFLTGIFAFLYKQYGQLPEVQPFGCGNFYHCHFLAFLCFCDIIKSFSKENAKFKPVLSIFRCGKCGIGSHHHCGLFRNG